MDLYNIVTKPEYAGDREHHNAPMHTQQNSYLHFLHVMWLIKLSHIEPVIR